MLLLILNLLFSFNTAIAETTAQPYSYITCSGLQEVQLYACEKVVGEFSPDEWEYFNDLIIRESKWNCKAQNPTSTAYGLGQFLNSTWVLVGYEKTSDCYIQIDATIDYIKKTYNTPKGAIVYHNKYNHY